MCLLSSPGVFLSGSNGSSGISYRGLCSFICTGRDNNSVHAESKSNRGRMCSRKKTVKAGDLVKGFHPSHATHPNHLKTQVELSSCFAQEGLCPRLSYYQGTTASYTSRTSSDFPFCIIVVNRRRCSCSKITANKSSLMNVFVLRLNEASFWGVYRTVYVPPKEGQLVSWRGCNVPTVVLRKGERDTSIFLAQILNLRHMKSQHSVFKCASVTNSVTHLPSCVQNNCQIIDWIFFSM